MNSVFPLFLAVFLFAAARVSQAEDLSDVTSSLPVRQISGDIHISDQQHWRDAHYRIDGNIVLHKGGTLTVENCVVELMCTFARQFAYKWDGGTLISNNATLGGTSRNGVSTQTYFSLEDGEWHATDTTIQHCYGITFAWDGRIGKLRALRLIAGKNPDSIIMGGTGDVIIKDSDYAISITLSSAAGGKGVLDLPVNTPLTQVYDASNLLGAQYRLELINTTVNLWFVFANILGEGPPAEILLANCPRFLPCLSAHNLRGELRLPCSFSGETPSRETRGAPNTPKLTPPGATFTTGNLTWKVGEVPLDIFAWGLYFSGRKTDVTIRGPVLICELILYDVERVRLAGDEGTHNVWSTATTIEADYGHFAEEQVPVAFGPDGKPEIVLLEMRNVALGRFMPNDSVRGQIGAFGNAKVIIEKALCDDLILVTKHQGQILLNNIEKRGELLFNKKGGEIRVDGQPQ